MKRHLILAFNADCCKCAKIAAHVERVLRERVEIRSLRNPEVSELRHTVYGDDAPWLPTLIEISDSGVRAWTGASLGYALAARVGLRDSLKLLRALGETRAATDSREASHSLSRAKFLRSGAVGGAVVFASMVAPSLARPAWSASLRSPAGGHVLMSDHVRGQAFAAFNQRSEIQTMTAELGAKIFDFESSKFFGAIHQIGNGNTLQVTALMPEGFSDRVLAMREFQHPQDGTSFEASQWKMTSPGVLELEGSRPTGSTPTTLWARITIRIGFAQVAMAELARS